MKTVGQENCHRENKRRENYFKFRQILMFPSKSATNRHTNVSGNLVKGTKMRG